MKPRNKNEREVEQLRHSLNDLNSPKRWRKTDWQWIAKNHEVGKTEYFAIYEVIGNWQVIRMFMCRSWSEKHEALHEPLRYWFKADGSFVIESKLRYCLGNYYIDAWVWDSDMAIRPVCGSRDVRNLYCNHMKIRSLIPELKRAGFSAKNSITKDLMPFWLVKSILTNNRIETFYKLRQNWLTWKFYHYDTHLLTESLWQSIRVALRHGYYWDNRDEINDWCDMIGQLEKLGKDTRNPHYICPEDLSSAHQYWNEKYNEMLWNKKMEQELKYVEKYEPIFNKNRKQFFGMTFSDNEIRISIITTALGIREEGVKMHHCVARYYNKPYSLILSAKVNGKRTETIEVNLKSYEIVQSRGVCNEETPYHERILDLVNKNMNEIIKRNKGHKMILNNKNYREAI